MDEQDPTPPEAEKQPGGSVDNAPEQGGVDPARPESDIAVSSGQETEGPEARSELEPPRFPGQVIPPEDLEILEDTAPAPEAPPPVSPEGEAAAAESGGAPSISAPEMSAAIEAPEPEPATPSSSTPEEAPPAHAEPAPGPEHAAESAAPESSVAAESEPEGIEPAPPPESEPEIEALAANAGEAPAEDAAPHAAPETEPVAAEEIFAPDPVPDEAKAPDQEQEPEPIAAFEAPRADAALFETDELGKTVFETDEGDEEAPTAQAARDEAPEVDVEVIPPPVIVEPPPRASAEAELDMALMRPAAPAEPPPPSFAQQTLASISALLAHLVSLVKKRGGETAAPSEPHSALAEQPPAEKLFTLRLQKVNVRRIAIMAGWMAAGVVVIVAAFFIYLTKDMPSTKSLWTADNSPSLTFVDRHGRVIIREGAESAPPVDLSRLPPYVAQAVLAIEDRRFYDHFGIDVGGLTRATLENFRAGHVVQGGSTITQQLAKNLFLSNSRTVKRKLQELALALWLESQFSKRDILALYMSRVYFGAGAYGIEAAAERYFDKPAKNLTLAEAALLAGLVKAPSKLNPAAQDAAAKARAKIVLDEMLSSGYITAAQHASALQSPLAISRNNPSGNLGYFRDWIDPQLVAVLGDQRDDFIVETTLDLDAQRAGETALQTVIDRERTVRRVSQGAVLAMDSTGGVTTMVGGLNYGKAEGQSEFNRTTQSLRAPGSSFKYFIYMTAMEKGITPWSVRVDRPVVIGDWAPGNYEDKYYGPVTLTTAYAKSLNMVAISLANEVGGQAVIDTAHKLGVGKRLENFRSLGLGAQGMTVMEMVTGYGAMAAGGYAIEPHGIERVRRANGQVLWARRPAKPPVQVIDDRTIRMMNLLGTTVVRAGTGTNARIEGRMIAGKTGTSNDYRDAWFIGYVPGMVAGVWVGNDDNTSMNKVTGGLLGAEVWKNLMTVALRDTPIQELPLPAPEDYPLTTLPAPTEAIPELPPITALGVQPSPAAVQPPPPPSPRRGGDG